MFYTSSVSTSYTKGKKKGKKKWRTTRISSLYFLYLIVVVLLLLCLCLCPYARVRQSRNHSVGRSRLVFVCDLFKDSLLPSGGIVLSIISEPFLFFFYLFIFFSFPLSFQEKQVTYSCNAGRLLQCSGLSLSLSVGLPYCI